MKAASAVESSATVERRATMEAACWPVSDKTGSTANEAGPSVESWVTIETRVSPIAGASVEAVEPRTSADKHAADKPVRTVVAVGRAGVWVIRVVPVGAHGRRADVRRADSHRDRSDSDADRNALCLRGRCGNQEYSKYRENSKNS